MTANTGEPTTSAPASISGATQRPLNVGLNSCLLSLEAPGIAGTWTLSIQPDPLPSHEESPLPWLVRLHDPQGNLHILSEDTKYDFTCLRRAQDRWQPSALRRIIPAVDRKVMGLLNKLTMAKFDSLSDQIIAWANKSEKEKDGRTLIQVIRLVFEKAIDEAIWSEMYARLCRKMMEQISPKVQDDGIRNAECKPIPGGQLFRKYLLICCQEVFERSWMSKEVTAAAAATKAVESANEKKQGSDNEPDLYSDEYYAAQKAKRQGLGLIRFLGELFKLQMLPERVMHQCVQKLLGNFNNPKEEDLEGLCVLLTTVGELLDIPRAHAHMDVYLARMKELTKMLTVSPRLRFSLQDVIELRQRNWRARRPAAEPTSLAQIHEKPVTERCID